MRMSSRMMQRMRSRINDDGATDVHIIEDNATVADVIVKTTTNNTWRRLWEDGGNKLLMSQMRSQNGTLIRMQQTRAYHAHMHQHIMLHHCSLTISPTHSKIRPCESATS